MFKAGDRVIYTGKDKSCSTNSFIGRTAVILQRSGSGSSIIKWDDTGTTYTPVNDNIELLPTPNKDEIEAALKVLQAAGKVEFKPNKPPFEPITIKLNSTHTAIVKATCVVVGCQEFTFERVDLLHMAVKRARDYTNS